MKRVLFKGEAMEWAKVKADAVKGWERARLRAIRQRGSINEATDHYLSELQAKGVLVGRTTLFKWARLLAAGGIKALAAKLPRCVYRIGGLTAFNGRSKRMRRSVQRVIHNPPDKGR